MKAARGLATARRELEIEVREAVEAVRSQARRMRLAGEALELAGKTARIEEGRLRRGLTLSYRMGQIRTDLASAATAELNARIDREAQPRGTRHRRGGDAGRHGVVRRRGEPGCGRRPVRVRRRQFVLEAVLLCTTGGLLGIGAGVTAAWGICLYTGWPFSVSPEAMVVGVGVSTGVGLLFGVYPALQAARLDPIAALRIRGGTEPSVPPAASHVDSCAATPPVTPVEVPADGPADVAPRRSDVEPPGSAPQAVAFNPPRVRYYRWRMRSTLAGSGRLWCARAHAAGPAPCKLFRGQGP